MDILSHALSVFLSEAWNKNDKYRWLGELSSILKKLGHNVVIIRNEGVALLSAKSALSLLWVVLKTRRLYFQVVMPCWMDGQMGFWAAMKPFARRGGGAWQPRWRATHWELWSGTPLVAERAIGWLLSVCCWLVCSVVWWRWERHCVQRASQSSWAAKHPPNPLVLTKLSKLSFHPSSFTARWTLFFRLTKICWLKAFDELILKPIS